MLRTTVSFNELHLLWPRSDGAVRFLAYLLRPIQNGETPRFTDQFLAQKFHKHTGTIARWRAQWKQMGILKSKRRAGRTYYEIDQVVLNEKVAEAKAAQEQREIEARGKAIADRTQRDTQIAQELRQQCREALSATPHFAGLEPGNLRELQRTDLRDISVLQGPGKWDCDVAETPDHLAPLHSSSEPTADSNPAVQTPQLERQWFLAAARRLVVASGQKWNQTLQKALEKLEGDRLVNLISACWEQQLRGNIRNLPRWLNKAAQKAAQGLIFRPSKKFRLPRELPAIAPSSISNHSSSNPDCIELPCWLPEWAKPKVEALLRTISTYDWIDEVDGGVFVRWPGGQQLILDSQQQLW